MGTTIVLDLRPGKDDGDVHSLANFNGVLVFIGNDGITGPELWRSRGTAKDTSLVANINAKPGSFNPNKFTMIGEIVFFTADNGVNGRELWKTDGTIAGTALVKDIFPGSDASYPDNLVAFGNELFFSARDANHGWELWKSDGTANGTVLVKDLIEGLDSPYVYNFFVFNGALYFLSAFGEGFEHSLWKSDGTSAGTEVVKEFGPSSLTNCPPVVINNYVLIPICDDSHGSELWRSDGTPAGTTLLKDIAQSSWSSLPIPFGVIGNILIFRAQDTSADSELWKTDGTEVGTVLIKDINTKINPWPGSSNTSSRPELLFKNPTSVFFTALDNSGKRNLWRSDGLESGTVLLKEINLDATISSGNYQYPVSISTSLDNLFFFAADDGSSESELWASDGTATGTRLVKDLSLKKGGSVTS